ncbi:MAG: PIN domain-containing protein [Deltaproteobacteria bacterium]|nr:PIN domain-containing protein [Deltaproteobacteria bacterium]
MGTLTLPASGLVYVDTQVVIYSVEKHPNYWPLLRPLWAASRAGEIEVISSELALLETLVGPLKNADTGLAASYEQLFTSTEMRLIPITTPILKDAARLRAELNLKTPDSLHAATALAAGCALFLTNDPGFRRVPGLPLAILNDVMTA